MSQVTARPHGPHRRQTQEVMFSGPGPHPGRGNGHGHGPHEFQGHRNGAVTIPGFPMKGPPSVPYVPPQQQPRGPVIYPGNNNFNNYPQQPGNTYPRNNLPIYVNNPFLPQQNTQGQGNFANRNNVPPKQYENIQHLPSIEPVTNDLPDNTIPFGSTVRPTINPRHLDLLSGSNLYEEEKEKEKAKQQIIEQQNIAQQNIAQQNFEEQNINFLPRVLIDTAPHCQEGYILVGTVCRRRI